MEVQVLPPAACCCLPLSQQPSLLHGLPRGCRPALSSTAAAAAGGSGLELTWQPKATQPRCGRRGGPSRRKMRRWKKGAEEEEAF